MKINKIFPYILLIGIGLICIGLLPYVLALYLGSTKNITANQIMIIFMSSGILKWLGKCLVLVGIVLILRHFFYKKEKSSSVLKSDDPYVVIQNNSFSQKKERLKVACFVSIYCIVVSLMIKVIPILFYKGDDFFAPFILWIFLMGLAIVLSFVTLFFGLVDIWKWLSSKLEKKKEESTALTALSILSCFVPISVLLLFFLITIITIMHRK